ncbi:hypothetical protein CEXT_155761 [Caerostris extrusa]|uniref:Uncharacterized protein n=1 Tax=Caerostris extrusa TaxID=172846 RepID=A0AAV4T400_CAEEX|nr:hypothetical protein CEXT_155761 [Caerostris extrusa]
MAGDVEGGRPRAHSPFFSDPSPSEGRSPVTERKGDQQLKGAESQHNGSDFWDSFSTCWSFICSSPKSDSPFCMGVVTILVELTIVCSIRFKETRWCNH